MSAASKYFFLKVMIDQNFDTTIKYDYEAMSNSL